MNNRKLFVGALVALMLVAFASVQAQNDRLIIGSTSEVSGFDPRTATDVPSFERINVIMEPLVVFDRGLGLQPRLATSWELAPDLSSITFTLREGVTFHNGRAFTAEDVRFTFETVLDPDFGAPNRSLYTAVDSIETPDDFTVIMNLNQPNAFLLNNIARQPIVPADAAVDGAEFNQRPVGTGPYQFESQVRDDRLVLARFDDYWGGAGSLAYLEFRVIPENATRLLSFEAGEIDATQGQLPPIELPRLEADTTFVLERTPGTGYTYLGFNTRVEPLNDVRVRQALSHLIPREAIVQRVLNGNGFPGVSMLLPTMPWFNPDVRTYDYDPELARQLLQDAGVDFSAPLRLYTNDNAVRMQIAEILAYEFSQIGLELQATIEEFGAFIARVQNSDDYDMFILGWGGQLDPDRAMIRQFHSGEAGSANYTYYANPRVDELLDRGRVTDPASPESVEIYQEASAIVVEEAPYAFVNYTEETALYQLWVSGWGVHPYSPNTYQDAHLITKNR
jgi:peptide/nickel transport system substrate-binding protein